MPPKKTTSPAPAKSSTPRKRAARTTAKASSNGESSAVSSPSYDQIAQAAYLRYVNRGGVHGSDFDDWVEAERELAASD